MTSFYKKPAAHTSASDESWNPTLTRRLRALLHADPLLGMRNGDSRRDENLQHYDSLSLVIKAFDFITEHMGLEQAVDRYQLTEALKPLLEKMDDAAAIERNRERHVTMVNRLVNALRNRTGQPFEIDYTVFDAGAAVRRGLQVRLMEEYESIDGRIVFRLTKEALNLFLNALDLDIEDAQIATEAVIKSQLSRGKFDEAVETAKRARIQSIRYYESIVTIIQQTKRDLSEVDWNVEVPDLLKNARSHLAARIDAEREMWLSARSTLDALSPESDHVRQVITVAELVDDCIQRHTQLQTRLMEARGIFLDEQDRQTFSIRRVRIRPHLQKEVLMPLLQMHKSDVAQVIHNSAYALLGAQPVPVFNLGEFINWLLRPRREVPEDELPVEELELVEASPGDTWLSPEVIAACNSYMEGIADGDLLSSVLERAKERGETAAVLGCIALSAFYAFAEIAEYEGGQLLTMTTGRPLRAAGFAGDDLQFTKLKQQHES